jgi:biopolymer transport protein ExbB
MEFLNQMSALFQKGGPVMYLLVLCSIGVLAIAIERFVYYRRVDNDPETFMAVVKQKIETADWNGAVRECEASNGALGAVLAKGLQRRNRERHSIETTLDGAATYQVAKLREQLNYLDTMVTLSPLLGLLGTVIGMIQSFSIMNVKAGQPMAITGGVGEALVATATGLCVAVMALVVHSYFNHRLDKIITNIEQACAYLLDELDRGDSHETA